jgi:hypothetical protein
MRQSLEDEPVKFMLLIYPDRSVELDQEARAAIPAAVGAWVDEMDRRGVRLMGAVLASADQAVTVQVRNGEPAQGEGPVVESEPHISGFNILECADLEEALEVTRKHPVARFGTLELRAFSDS